LRRAARPRRRALARALRVRRGGRLRHRHPARPLSPRPRARRPRGRGGRSPHLADARHPRAAQARRVSGHAHARALAGLLLRRADVDPGHRGHRRPRQPADPLSERAARLAALEAADHPLLCGRDGHLPGDARGPAHAGLPARPRDARGQGQRDPGGRVRLAAFAISGFFSGLAGALLTVVLEFVPIENIHWQMSGTVLIMTLFGGTATLLGPFVGAGVFIWMRDFLSKHLEYWEVFVGGAFVLIVLFLPDGIVGSLTRLRARRRPPPATGAVDQLPDPAGLVGAARPVAPDGRLLESRGLRKTFGGLTAVNGVDFQVRPGELRSVIGPNGAGKTTFFNLLTGVLPPSAGRILFKGRDITGLPAHAVSRLGIARSYQVTNIFGDLTVYENVRIAAQSRVTHYRFWGRADALAPVNRRAEEIIVHMGLSAQRHALARELSHGEQRYLEIGIALATDPDFLLLDEPTAGMSPDETRRTAAFVRRLAGHVTIVVVEHDMEVVMGISDRITVLNYGEILAEGTPAEIRENADVRRVYLRD